MTTSSSSSWVDYYHKIYANETTWLDYSNAHVQGQTFGIALEAAGPVCGKRCLDVGCGRGQLSLVLAALLASEVVGVDIIEESISECRVRYPHVRWEVGTPEDEEFCRSLGRFDLIFCIELLQLVGWQQTLKTLWNRVSSGGRIVVVVPNKSNPIVQKTIDRFAGRYVAPTPTELASLVDSLPDVECWAYRGMDFQQDQRIVPYVTSPWMTTASTDFNSNRLVVAIQKQTSSIAPSKN
ncbi:class I SAM-dependent methyltransferase [Schlesneria sp.]|uniref:class I SAM-dependent methyltransferase n=1 Tax=Schlesneria sp. TaxID=2762018 RepID=UPI002EF091B2